MNTKHTPGPWQAIAPRKKAGNGMAGRWSVASATQPIADVLNDSQDANARVIAAAPEMADTLRRAAIDLDDIASFVNAAAPDHAAGLRTMALAFRALLERLGQ